MIQTKKAPGGAISEGVRVTTTKVANSPENTKNFSENNQEETPVEKAIKEQMKDKPLPLLNIWSDQAEETVQFLFQRGDAGVIAKNNFHLIKGKTGSAKSFLGMDFILASQGRSNIFALNGEPLKVLWADTEQGAPTICERARVAFTSRGLTPDAPISVLHLRPYEPAERREYVKRAINELRPQFVLIDTLPDLMDEGTNDKNDTAKAFVEEFQRLTETNDCTIVAIIHTNKSLFDNNAAGHMGTVSEQKAREVYMMEKGKGIANTKRTWGPVLKEIPFAFTHDWTITGDPASLENERLRELREAGDSCFAFGEIRAGEAKERIAHHFSCQDRQAANILGEMVRSGILERREVNKNEVYYSLHTEERETPPSM